MLHYAFLLALTLIVTAAASSDCNEWIKADDDSTYKSLKQGFSEKAQIPIKS